MKLLIFLMGLPFLTPGQDNGFVSIKTGQTWCGLVRRSQTQVQMYCLVPGSNTQTLFNSILTVTRNPQGTFPATIIPYTYWDEAGGVTSIVWSVGYDSPTKTGIIWEFCGSYITTISVPCTRTTGTIVNIYGQPPQPQAIVPCSQVNKPIGCTGFQAPWSGTVYDSSGFEATVPASLYTIGTDTCMSWWTGNFDPTKPFLGENGYKRVCPITEILHDGTVLTKGQWAGIYIK